MIFRKFNKFISRNYTEVNNVIAYLSREYNNIIDDLETGLSRLRLPENFESDRKTVSLSDSGETEIIHNLGAVPDHYLVLNGIGGVIRGSTSWTNERIYLQLDSDLYTSKTKSVDILIMR